MSPIKDTSPVDALTASPALPVTISPAEFGVLVDLAVNANAPVGRVLQLGDLFARCVKLANSSAPIGALIPTYAAPEGATLGGAPESTYADKHRLNRPAS